jgi:hypothetical protein
MEKLGPTNYRVTFLGLEFSFGKEEKLILVSWRGNQFCRHITFVQTSDRMY